MPFALVSAFALALAFVHALAFALAFAFVFAFALPLPLPLPFPSLCLSLCLLQVECLGNRMLPYLATALEVLMHVSADCQDMCDVLALLNQLMLRYKTSLQNLLQEVKPAFICLPVHLCLCQCAARSSSPVLLPAIPPARPPACLPARPSTRPPARPLGCLPARPPARPPAYKTHSSSASEVHNTDSLG